MKHRGDTGDNDTETLARTRRQLLKYGGAAAVGLVTGAVLPMQAAEAGADADALHLGQTNSSDQFTELTGSLPGSSLLLVANTGPPGAAGLHGDGPNGATGVVGTSSGGPGVHGLSHGDPPGVLGESNLSNGIEGYGGVTGVLGTSRGGGKAAPGFGVKGEANNPGGIGVSGEGDAGGVVGRANDEAAAGVRGEAFGGRGIGVHGEGTLRGVTGHSNRGAGVEGTSELVEGVVGTSREGYGVVGYGGRGGVRGIAEADTPGVLAQSGVLKGDVDGGLALDVAGQARFSNAGQGTVPAGQSKSAPITPPNGFRGPSHVMVTLTSNPSGLRTVQWVEVTDTNFTVHLTPSTPQFSPEVTFTYLVVELPATAT
jgi:hypothetical protein